MGNITTLVPVSTTNQVQMPPFPGGTASQVLSDSDDGTYVTSQFSEFESVKAVWGVGPGAMTQLPVGAGKVNSATFKVRGNRSTPGEGTIQFGEYPNSRVSGTTTATITTFTGSPVTGVWTKASEINALGWMAQAVWFNFNGMSMFIMRGEVDVDWDPLIGGFRGMAWSLLGPLAGITLADIPRMAAEIQRLARTRIDPGFYVKMLREIKDYRSPKYFVLE